MVKFMFLQNLDHPLLLLEITLCHFREPPSRDLRTARDISTNRLWSVDPWSRPFCINSSAHIIRIIAYSSSFSTFLKFTVSTYFDSAFFHIFMVFRCPNFGFPMVEYFVNFVNVGMLIIKSKKRPMKGEKNSANNCSNEFSGDLNIRWQRPRH